MLVQEFSQDVLLETQPHQSLMDVTVDVKLREKANFKEWQKGPGTIPTPNADLQSSSSGQLGFEARFTARSGTNSAERDIEADGKDQCIVGETLWPTPMTPKQSPFELSNEVVDAQLMNDIFRGNEMARSSSLGLLPMQQHEMLPQKWTSNIVKSARWAGSEFTVSASIMATQHPDLPIFLEPNINPCLPLPLKYSRCRYYRSRSPISTDKCQSQIRVSGQKDLLLNRIRGGGDLQCQISDKATEDSFTDLPQFRPYSQFAESAVRFERPGLGAGIEPDAGSDIEHPIEIRDEIAEHSMAGITPSPEYTSHMNMGMQNRSHDSSPPDMTRATSARTDSRDAGKMDEHTILEYSADHHSINRSERLVDRAQKVVENDTRRCPNPSCSTDFQDFAYQQAQPSDQYGDPENVEFRSQRPSIANTPDYMIPPANAVGPPLHFEDAGCRRYRYGLAPSLYDAVCSDAQQAAHGHTKPLSFELPPLRKENCHPTGERLLPPDQLQEVFSGPPGLNEQYHIPFVQNQNAVPCTTQPYVRPQVPYPQHHPSYLFIPYTPAATPMPGPINPHSPLLDPSTAACAGPGFCMLPAPHVHYTSRNVLPRSLTIGDIVDFSTAQPSLFATNPQTHALAVGLYQAQQNAEHANVPYQLQGRILPAPQNTAQMLQQSAGPYALRSQGLLRSQVVTPQMYPMLNPRPPALPPSGYFTQGRSRGRSRGRGRKRALDSRDPSASHTLGYSGGNLRERMGALSKAWVRGRSRKTRRVRTEGGEAPLGLEV